VNDVVTAIADYRVAAEVIRNQLVAEGQTDRALQFREPADRAGVPTPALHTSTRTNAHYESANAFVRGSLAAV
jgi:hypothetical protein